MSLIQLINPFSLVRNLWRQRELIIQLTRRDVLARYKGSFLGILWSFLTPILMLTVYTFVFSVVLKARWGAGSDSKVEFALILFCGLNAYGIFQECINRSPNLILTNVNFVKKVLFPLEILSVVALCSAIINGVIGFIVLILGLAVLMGIFHWTIFFFPLVIMPLLLITLGLSWLFASLGVYLRDIGQMVGIFTAALLFLSPIFYSVSAVPQELQILFYFNPISYVVEDLRRIFIWGQLPDWNWLLLGNLIGFIAMILGHAWFQKTRGGFADVL